MNGFWNKLSKPIFSLAPMADVTDVSFRFLLANCMGKPNVIFNEFVSADGLARNREALISKLGYSTQERPIVAQFFGSKPEYFYESAKVANELGYDGIDINMGCPSRKVLSPKQASGAALITNPPLAKQIVQITKEALNFEKPVSVKTRIGFDKIEIEEWIPLILSSEPACLTLHLRTKKELSLVPAHWKHEILDRIVELRNQISPNTLLVGNGDVETYEQGIDYINQFKIDGIMIGRAVYGNPWLFNKNLVIQYQPGTINPTEKQKQLLDQQFKISNGLIIENENQLLIEITLKEVLTTMVKHIIILEILTPFKPIRVLFSHFNCYLKCCSNLGDTSNLKRALLECQSSEQVLIQLNNYLLFKNKSDQLLNYSEIKLSVENLINNSTLIR
ncbi:hypothetical protein ACTA71_005309 [Dictyostelium dimigraforme]